MADLSPHPFRSSTLTPPTAPPSRLLRVLACFVPEIIGADWRWYRRARGGRWERIEWSVLKRIGSEEREYGRGWCRNAARVEWSVGQALRDLEWQVIDVEFWRADGTRGEAPWPAANSCPPVDGDWTALGAARGWR